MKLFLSAVLLSCLTRPALAQAPKPAQVDTSLPPRVKIVELRKERPSLMEALMLKDKRLTVTIRKLVTSAPDKIK